MLLALLTKICLAWNTYGTNDALSFEVASQRAGRGEYTKMYQEGDVFPLKDGKTHWQVYNHPPPLFLVLTVFRTLEKTTLVPLRFWLRVADALADVITFLAVAAIAEASAGALALIAASPVAMLISGFHGNTDPLMIMFLAVSALCVHRGKAALAGVMVAAALGIKFAAILLVPALFFHLKSTGARARFALSAGAVVFVTWMPFIEDPVAILRSVVGYSSVAGAWGFTTLTFISARFDALSNLTQVYAIIGRCVVPAAAVWIGWHWRHDSIYVASGLVFLMFLTITPGFGVQYLVWLVPWIAIVPIRMAVVNQVACGLFLSAVYTYWSGGLPWYYADSFNVGLWRGPLLRGLELLAWLSVCVCWWLVGRRVIRPGESRLSNPSLIPAVPGGEPL